MPAMLPGCAGGTRVNKDLQQVTLHWEEELPVGNGTQLHLAFSYTLGAGLSGFYRWGLGGGVPTAWETSPGVGVWSVGFVSRLGGV